ncbi:stearoyl-CoA 9-desaturase [Streptomyces iconiensis]|uniref:Stearoyl-CoA 9-desaturase n=1 Tax=Streptomyces iconiensis TaxID=1384038 RepID=A0ABT6ZUL4_9ACTN|nr:stearoyl-CoA 9-desaturase [Streptomyces iconiensis]MDJ1132757.1 stearoyl-CoA 9-desaturase [Streptomyces iconiensis]
MGALAAGTALATALWVLGGWWLLLLPVGWGITLHGMRNLRMMIFHQCAHRNMYRRRTPDTVIGRAAAALLVIQNFERYCREHVADHHAVHHMTLRDPTVQAFLISLGLAPGMTRDEMWRRVLGKVFSPLFHLRFAVARARSFWTASAPVEKVTAGLLYGGVLGATVATGTWAAFLVVWCVPLIPLFQMSNILRLCVKHTFPSREAEVRKGREYFAGLTNAIFIGEAAPAGGGAGAWCRWSVRMLFLHAPTRYLVLTGDTVVHDFHHRYPSSREWHDYLFARQRDLETGHRGWPGYEHVWGLVPAINRVFDSLAAADPDEYNATRLASVSKRELFAAFDD